MGSFAGNGGEVSNQPIQKHRGAEGSPNATYTRALARMESEENLREEMLDLECQPEQREDEIIPLKKEISGGTQRLKLELQAREILLDAKEKQVRRPRTRGKRRIYFP
jgi:hypothetical protein